MINEQLDKIISEVYSRGQVDGEDYISSNPKSYEDVESEAKQSLLQLIKEETNKARIDEWNLISEVQHSAGITAELYFDKNRKDRIKELKESK
jgi:hypothetical protein